MKFLVADCITASLPLQRWQGDRGTYHLVTFVGKQAEHISMHARLHRLEFGKRRGFGSVKVIARIGQTEWKTSVFPIKLEELAKQADSWTLLISKKVKTKEELSVGSLVPVILQLL